MNDYLSWTAISVVFGFVGYFLLKRLRPEASAWTRIGLAVLLIPIFAMGLIALLISMK